MKVTLSVFSPDINEKALSLSFVLKRWAPMQPTNIGPTLDLCTMTVLDNQVQYGNVKFARHFYTNLVPGIKPLTFSL